MTAITVPDGIEVVASRADALALALPPFLVLDAVEAFLDAHGLGAGPIAWSRIGNGQSNLTFALQRGDDTFVLRRGPRPPHPKSTHDMMREARIQQLVAKAGVPVPRILAACDDDSVLGVPFYVMEFLEGEVITTDVPPAFDRDPDRAAISLAAVDALLAIHRIDVTSGELARLGRPDGYLRRQVNLFTGLWAENTTRHLPEVALVSAWLSDNLPESQAAAIVHGDFRIGNLMFAPPRPVSVSAVLDWEMATIGDPLADLGYFTATYSVPGSTPSPMDLTPVTRERGFLSREQLVERYRESNPLDLSALGWYQALALWKAAIFCEAMYTRWLKGERPDDTTFAPTLEDGVPVLLSGAMGFAGLTAR